jgi:hypothetical protein
VFAIYTRLIFGRLCFALHLWMTTYPGDFSGKQTYRLLCQFIDSILLNATGTVAHQILDIKPWLPFFKHYPDPELPWALPDPLDERDDGVEISDISLKSIDPSFRKPSMASINTAVSTKASSIQSHNTLPSVEHSSRILQTSIINSGSSTRSGINLTPVVKRDRSVSDAGTADSTGSDGSNKYVPPPRGPSSMSHIRMDISARILSIPDWDIAQQISRLAWEIFGEMKVSYTPSLSDITLFLAFMIKLIFPVCYFVAP